MRNKIISLMIVVLIVHVPIVFCDNSTIYTQFEEYAQKMMDDWKVPGMAIAIVEGKNIVYTQVFGVKQVGTEDKVTPNTLFRIGSISKSFTSALMGILVDKKRVSWKDKVKTYYPAFMLHDLYATYEFMIEDLFAQNSGLPERVTDNQAHIGYSSDDMLQSLRFIKPVSSFRSQFAYQNVIFLAADKVMESITQKKWDVLVDEYLFKPLGMNASSATYSGFENATDVTRLHQKKDGSIVAIDKKFEGDTFSYTLGPAGGINSTINDMANYLVMMINHGTYNETEIITPETIDYLVSPKMVIDFSVNQSFYCQGWMRNWYNNMSIVWHNGSTPGNKNMIAYIPEKNIGIVILSNFQDNDLPETLAFDFFDMYIHGKNGDMSSQFLAKRKKKEDEEQKKKEEERKKIEENTKSFDGQALPFVVYEGTYHNKVYGDVEIITKDNVLSLLIGPKKVTMKLEHIFRDTFRLHWLTPASDISFENDKVYFTINHFGQAIKMYCEFFKDEADGIFERVAGKI